MPPTMTPSRIWEAAVVRVADRWGVACDLARLRGEPTPWIGDEGEDARLQKEIGEAIRKNDRGRVKELVAAWEGLWSSVVDRGAPVGTAGASLRSPP